MSFEIDKLDELLDKWEQARDLGERLSPEELCADAPDLIPALRHRIERLDAIDAYLQPALHDLPGRTHPETIGPYAVIGLLGQGGMGVVYRCRQQKPSREVAVKVIRPERLSPNAIRRFELELETSGALSHPGIARVFDAGATDIGAGLQPYYVMELIQGRPLHRYVEEERLGVKEVLQLALLICDALDNAHHKGVIHRDLKPDNILVDDHGQPKIVDFGLARLTTTVDCHSIAPTETFGLVGSLAFMSPEQVAGNRLIDTRTDVYSLGVILYRLLAGRPPYDTSDKALFEAMRVVRETSPPKLGQINSKYRGDLETIVATALAKEQVDRYQSVAELAHDIRCLLSGSVIRARPLPPSQRMLRWCRRHALATSLMAITFVAICGGLVASSYFAYRASQSLRHAEMAMSELTIANQEASNARLESEERRLAVERQMERVRQSAFSAQLARASTIVDRDPALAVRLLEDEASCPPDLRRFAWRLLRHLCKRGRFVEQPAATVIGSAFSKSERYLVYVTSAGNLHLYDLHENRELERHRLSASITHAWLSADGALVAIRNADGQVSLWKAPNQRVAVVRAAAAQPVAAISPSKAIFAYPRSDGTWEVVDTRDGTSQGQLPSTSQFTAATISSDNTRLLALDSSRHLHIWDIESRTELFNEPIGRGEFDHALLSRAGFAVFGIARHAAHVWEIDPRRRVAILPGRIDRETPFALTHDGERLAVSFANQVTLWDARRWTEILRWPSNVGVNSIAFSRTARKLVIVDAQNRIHVWSLGLPEPSHLIVQGEGSIRAVQEVLLAPDGERLYTSARDGGVRAWQLDSGEQAFERLGKRFTNPAMALSPSGKSWAYADAKSQIVVMNAETETIRSVLPNLTGQITDLAFLGEESLVSAGIDGAVWQWDVDSAQTTSILASADSPVHSVCVFANHEHLATGHEDGAVRIWQLRNQGPPVELHGRQRRTDCLVLSPDNKTLVAAGGGPDIFLWDAFTGLLKGVLRGHFDRVFDLAFSPDGDALVSCSGDGTIRCWNVETLQEEFSLSYDLEKIQALAISADGRRFISATSLGKIRVLDINSESHARALVP